MPEMSGDKLLERLRDRNMTAADLAVASGLPKHVVMLALRGGSDADTLYKLHEALLRRPARDRPTSE